MKSKNKKKNKSKTQKANDKDKLRALSSKTPKEEAKIWEGPLLLLHNIKDEQPTYVINPEPIRAYYNAKYANIVLGHKDVLWEAVFPPAQTLDIETLSWKSATIASGLPESSPCPFSVARAGCERQVNAAPSISERTVKLNAKAKAVMEYIKSQSIETRVFKLQKLSRAANLLEGVGNVGTEPSASRDYHEFRLQPYRFNERAFDMVANLTLRWMKSIDRYVIEAYNGTSFYAEENRLLRIKLDFLTKDYASTVVALILRRAVGFCKKCCNGIHRAIKRVIDHYEYCPDIKFTKSQNSSESEENLSDEDEYTHTFGLRKRYKRFELDKENYTAIAILILQLFNELKNASVRLDYLYTTAFRIGYGATDVQSSSIHLGLFYEIVLGDSEILEVLDIIMRGLREYTNANKKASHLFSALDSLIDGKAEFNDFWQKKLRHLSNSFDQYIFDKDFPGEANDEVMDFDYPEYEKQQRQKRNKNKRKKKKRKQQLNTLKAEERLAEDVHEAIAKLALFNVDELFSYIGLNQMEAESPKIKKETSKSLKSTCNCKTKEEEEEESEEEKQKAAELKRLYEKYKNRDNKPRLKPNISKETLQKMKNSLINSLRSKPKS